jgi:hypothetical protein
MKTTRIIAAALLACAACGSDGEEACDETVAGNICTIAGSHRNGYSGDDGPALDARFSLPMDTLAAPDGTIFILDWNNHRVRKLEADGTIRHVAGRGELGGTLDDPANGDFNHPTGMLLDETGNKLVIAAWHNSKIRTIDLITSQIVDTCGDGRRAYFGDDGPALPASLDLPASIAWDPQGQLVIMDQANQVIRYIDDAGNIHRLAGKCVLDKAPLDCAGADPMPCPSPNGKFTCGDPAMTCAANPPIPCNPSYNGDEVPALEARLAQPFGQSADPAGRIVFDGDGNLYFADTTNALIRVLGTDGIVRNFAGTPPVDGMPQTGFEGDGGPALSAKLNNPVDLAFAPDGTLYVSDVYNHCIRAIGTDGIITTAAGMCGQKGYDGDGGPANAALLNVPYGVDVANGKLYITDTGNNVIRSVLLP